MTSLIQKESQGIAVRAGGFHAGMDPLDTSLLEPLSQRCKPLRRIDKVVRAGCRVCEQMDIESVLAISMSRAGSGVVIEKKLLCMSH
jgi:hypothetical protein